MKFSFALGSLILGTMFIPGIATAADSGFYAGVNVGQSKARSVCDNLALGVNCDDKDTGWKILGGYQFNRNLGVEAAYVDLGKATASDGVITASIKTTGFELSGVGTLPIADRFSVYSKLGLFRFDAEGSAPGVSVSDKGTSATYGIGLKYDITQTVGARAEWQRYSRIGGDNLNGKSDVDLLSLGLVIKF